MYVNNFSTGSGETINFMAALIQTSIQQAQYLYDSWDAATNILRKENRNED